MGFRPSLKGGCFLTTTTATAVPMCSRVRAPHVVLKARLPWVPFSSMWAYLCHSIGVFGSGQALEKPCTVLNWSLCSPAILWWIVKDKAYDNQFWSPVVWELFLGCCPGYLPVAESLPPPNPDLCCSLLPAGHGLERFYVCVFWLPFEGITFLSYIESLKWIVGT